MAWINANAPAVQAIAALASVLVAAILAAITWRYVRLTRELVTTTRRELEVLMADRAALLSDVGCLDCRTSRGVRRLPDQVEDDTACPEIK